MERGRHLAVTERRGEMNQLRFLSQAGRKSPEIELHLLAIRREDDMRVRPA